MASDDQDRRPKRRCTQRKNVPSTAHYVGYVEDNETPEMIMHKFEQLEAVKASIRQRAATIHTQGSAEAADGELEHGAEEDPLAEEHLQDMFGRTSNFSIRRALAGNDLLVGQEDSDGDEGQWSDSNGSQDNLAFSSEDEDETYGGGPRRRGTRGKGTDRPRISVARASKHTQPRAAMLYNPTTKALIRRRFKVVDKRSLVRWKVPHPLPLSWGKLALPYRPASKLAALRGKTGTEPQHVRESTARFIELPSFAGSHLLNRIQQTFQAVLINPGWNDSAEPGADCVARNLASIPVPKLTPRGFVCIWADKTRTWPIFQQLRKWGYVYVENLTWVWTRANNTIITAPDERIVAQRSHMTMLIFRHKTDGRDIQLKHQRNPDVVFDCIRSAPGKPLSVPLEAYRTIEVMLPESKGQLLELWSSPKGSYTRPGWLHATILPAAE